MTKDLEGGMTFTLALQILTSSMATCDRPHLRFYGYQLLAQCLTQSDDQVRLYALMELLSNCPYATIRTASIGLLKDQVIQHGRQPQSVFGTRILIDRFLPVIFDHVETQSAEFADNLTFHLQAIAFYYFLLQWDKHDKKVELKPRSCAQQLTKFIL
ncbi:hypothetical protein DM01DRAFT_310373 [Hesseltinella vesiculosa]|uniref:Uncharacterized protein n=1 Tax=Hesseltinella vesiculosa TaxID=101127 RepID=A0A1X2GR23_9FUNG|nr:hypothetical protein DM01DRAFT_310373 [Hesseltinella vesiculosa]